MGCSPWRHKESVTNDSLTQTHPCIYHSDQEIGPRGPPLALLLNSTSLVFPSKVEIFLQNHLVEGNHEVFNEFICVVSNHVVSLWE